MINRTKWENFPADGNAWGKDDPEAGLEVSVPATVAEAIAQLCKSLGIRYAFGVSGGAMAMLWEALSDQLQVLHFRHESGAAFAATEAYFASNQPVVVFTTTGPGITNALTGLFAARGEGAKVILLSAYTSGPLRGRGAIQETSSYTLPTDLFSIGSLFEEAIIVEHTGQLPQLARRLAHGLAKPAGFIAHVSIPTAIQAMKLDQPLPPFPLMRGQSSLSPQTRDRCLDLLAEDTFAIWLGFGARDAAPLVRQFAQRTGAAVMCSPRGKGIFPEDHPQFVGVTGMGGHRSVSTYMQDQAPHRILVLGTRLGEPTSFFSPLFVPAGGFIHVDLNATVPGVAYPDADTFAVQAEVAEFLQMLLDHWSVNHTKLQQPDFFRLPWLAPTPRAEGLVRPEVLMHAIQQVMVDGSDAVVLAESGNSFTWATHYLRFATPHRYRVSTAVGAMGHAVTGVTGAAIARGGKAIAIVGDGAMLMNSEVNTAVKYSIPAVWVVLNDARYNMCHQGMATLGLKGGDGSRWHSSRSRSRSASRLAASPKFTWPFCGRCFD
jgi:thiamine pyrophosphate-dependent acetolactate synthase large subunit-like protein